MASNRKEKLFPVKNTISISILLEDLNDFENIFWNKKLYNFHINNKTIKENEVIFEVRSMRVNEFIDILDDNNIIWRDFYSKY